MKLGAAGRGAGPVQNFSVSLSFPTASLVPRSRWLPLITDSALGGQLQPPAPFLLRIHWSTCLADCTSHCRVHSPSTSSSLKRRSQKRLYFTRVGVFIVLLERRHPPSWWSRLFYPKVTQLTFSHLPSSREFRSSVLPLLGL